jgi:hypothetical protein
LEAQPPSFGKTEVAIKAQTCIGRTLLDRIEVSLSYADLRHCFFKR